jgi:hypothetical protein
VTLYYVGVAFVRPLTHRVSDAIEEPPLEVLAHGEGAGVEVKPLSRSAIALVSFTAISERVLP